MTIIGEFFRQKRMEKNLSIRQLAKYTSISPAYISQIENGYRKNPTPHVLKSLCEGLGIDFEQFLIETEQLSKTELKERSRFYEQYIASTDEENKERWGEMPIDLEELLASNVELRYNAKLLNEQQRKKIKLILHALFDDG